MLHGICSRTRWDSHMQIPRKKLVQPAEEGLLVLRRQVCPVDAVDISLISLWFCDPGQRGTARIRWRRGDRVGTSFTTDDRRRTRRHAEGCAAAVAGLADWAGQGRCSACRRTSPPHWHGRLHLVCLRSGCRRDTTPRRRPRWRRRRHGRFRRRRRLGLDVVRIPVDLLARLALHTVLGVRDLRPCGIRHLGRLVA